MSAVKYQVALSFAGEQRPYVEDVARHLVSRGVAVFYDGFETVPLWGRDGAEVFHEAFAEQSALVVMFVSTSYIEKSWPRHERRSTLSRMVKEEREYVLPVRFDDTRVPGLPDDVIFLRADEYTAAALSAAIAEKLGVERFNGKASDLPPPRMTSPMGEVVFDYSSYNGRYIIGSGQLEFETKWTKANRTSIHAYNDPTNINGVALARGFTLIPEVIDAAGLDFTSRTRTPSLGQIIVLRNTKGFYAALQVLAIKDDKRGDSHDELRFRYAIQPDGSDSFANIGAS